MKNLDIKLLPYQIQFLKSTHPRLWFRGGLGSGKSKVLAHYLIGKMLTNPETMGVLVAATYKQLRYSVLAHIFNTIREDYGLRYDYNAQSGMLTMKLTGGQVLTGSMEQYEWLRGIEFGYGGVDEVCSIREEAINVLEGRIRCSKSKSLEVKFTGTPNGFDFMYDRVQNGTIIDMHATSHGNPFLPPDYLINLERVYSPAQYEQEVNAGFVNALGGQVYSFYDPTDNDVINMPEPLPGQKIMVGVDFNVNPLCAALMYENQIANTIDVFDEIYLEHSNTYLLRDELCARFSGSYSDIELYPDATGGFRKSSSKKSDHDILKEKFKVISRKVNPPIKTRYNTVNGHLRSKRLRISTRCKHLRKDLRQYTYEESKKNNTMLGHISDALGYPIAYKYPIVPNHEQSKRSSLWQT